MAERPEHPQSSGNSKSHHLEKERTFQATLIKYDGDNAKLIFNKQYLIDRKIIPLDYEVKPEETIEMTFPWRRLYSGTKETDRHYHELSTKPKAGSFVRVRQSDLEKELEKDPDNLALQELNGGKKDDEDDEEDLEIEGDSKK